MVKKSLLWVYRATLATLWLFIIVLAGSVLALRYVVLPHIDDYKETIAQHATAAAGQKITIGEIGASWDGLNPHLSLLNVQLYDRQNRPALTLDHIETSLSWLSIPLMEPRLSALTIHQPQLTVRREANGTIYVAGISMSEPGKSNFPNWLLRQSEINVLDATVLWLDDLRHAPPLMLNQLNLQVQSPAWESFIGHHRIGMHATPSAGSSQPIDLRANIYGTDLDQLDDWHGTLYAKLEGTDIAAWRNWISYPFDLREGYGAARFWLNFTKGQVQSVTSDVILSNVVTRLSKTSAEAKLNNLSGRLKWTLFSDGHEVSAERIKLSMPDGLNMHNGKIRLRNRTANGKESVEGDVALDEIRLESLNTLATYLPIEAQALKKLAEIAPVGKLEQLQLNWKGDQPLPQKYSLHSRFAGLGTQPYQGIPGFTNISGSIDADEKNGTLTINAHQAMLDIKHVMRWPIPADSLTGQVKWQNSKDKTEVHVSNLAIANTHMAGTINATYQATGVKGGYLDLTGKFGQIDAKFAHYYYPNILGEETQHWLDTSILAGRGEDVNLIIKGYLDEFPYADNKKGLFKVTAKISDGVLDYGTGWPRIEGLNLDMLFQGDRMELNANKGHIIGNQIIKSRAVIPVLDAEHPVLEVIGDAQGPASEGIRFVNNSPVSEAIDHFTDGMKANGNGKLHLELRIPLDNVDATKVKGVYEVSNGTLSGDSSFPELSRISGKLEFTESSMRAQNVAAWIYGGPAAFNMETGKDGLLRIAARGRISDAGLKQAFGPGLADYLSGSTEWSGDINIHKQQADFAIRSALFGMASSLPAPLAKAAGDQVPLRIEKKLQSPQQDIVSLNYGNVLSAKLLRIEQKNEMHIERGEIGINQQAEIPSQSGINVRGTLDHLNMDEWRSLFGESIAGKDSAISINKVDLAINVLDIFERRINQLKLNAKPSSDGWQVNLQSKEITGDAQWRNQGNNKITARLKNLTVPGPSPNNPAELPVLANAKPRQQTQDYPALDIIADNFENNQKKLGRLELSASVQGNDWRIEKLQISNPDSLLSAEGEWRNWKHNPNTRVNLKWDIKDIGKTLDRFGYPGMVKGGDANLTGQLKWAGSPHEFNIAGLGGNLQLEARHGQFLKIQPGVGRLLSIVSLQSLPRRLTLDFRDIFSSGFSFDKISGNLQIDRGIMKTDDFRMEGSSAKVAISGETDLDKGTQRLRIQVTPSISDSLSLAAFAGGPVVGAAAFIAQKILKDPFSKLIAYEYEIAGTWDNPQEVNIDGSKPAAVSPLGK